ELLLHHYRLSLACKGEERGVREMRKLYSSYLRDYPYARQVRYQLVRMTDPKVIEEYLLQLLEEGLQRHVD
nr:hypothetical protein [bacterium]